MIAERLGFVGRSALVLLSVLLLQVAVVADLEAFGERGDLILLMAIAAGSVAGPDRGATIGFATGLSYDLLLDTPFGLSVLTCVVAGYAAGWVTSLIHQPQWWFHVAASAGISVVAVIFSLVVARVLGLAFVLGEVVNMALVIAVWNGALILPARRVWRWVYSEEDTGRYRVAMS
jgi:rod shape-determining protein MreD